MEVCSRGVRAVKRQRGLPSEKLRANPIFVKVRSSDSVQKCPSLAWKMRNSPQPVEKTRSESSQDDPAAPKIYEQNQFLQHLFGHTSAVAELSEMKIATAQPP
jgi:hypothetical protein